VVAHHRRRRRRRRHRRHIGLVQTRQRLSENK